MKLGRGLHGEWIVLLFIEALRVVLIELEAVGLVAGSRHESVEVDGPRNWWDLHGPHQE